MAAGRAARPPEVRTEGGPAKCHVGVVENVHLIAPSVPSSICHSNKVEQLLRDCKMDVLGGESGSHAKRLEGDAGGPH